MRMIHTAMVLAIIMAPLFIPAHAGAQVPASIEGPITAIDPLKSTMTVVGVIVHVPRGIPITTPTANLTELAGAGNPLELLLGRALDGRKVPGFMAGTAIITGVSLPSGNMRAAEIFVEPSENVLIGPITEAVCINADCEGAGNTLKILRAQLSPIRDQRMRFTITNDFGFPVDLTNANLVGAAASAEGYFVPSRFFRYFLLEITGAPLRNPGVTEVSIQRAQCRPDVDGIQLDVLGATHTPAIGTVTISNGGTTFGAQATISAGVGSEFGAYTFRLRDNPAFNACPDTITATFEGATASAQVDIRE